MPFKYTFMAKDRIKKNKMAGLLDLVPSAYATSQLKYWEAQKKKGPGGRPRKIESPDKLWDLCCAYFIECTKTPWTRVDYRGKEARRVETPITRPFTVGGLSEYLRGNGVIAKLDDYMNNSNDRYAEFSNVVTRVKNIIRTQKLEGAIVGVYNSNIVANVLGLVKKQEMLHTVEQPLFGPANPTTPEQ